MQWVNIFKAETFVYQSIQYFTLAYDVGIILYNTPKYMAKIALY